MKIIVENQYIQVTDATEAFKRDVISKLYYTNKSIEYRINKMKKNPFHNKQILSMLEKDLKGQAFTKSKGVYSFPSGFYYLISEYPHEDKRCANGQNISYPWMTKPYPLRPYQEEAVEIMASSYRGLINFATGLGKTLTTIYAVRHIQKKTLIICPGKSIAENFYKELVAAFGESRVGYFGDGKKKIKDITVGIARSVQLSINLFKKEDLGLIVIDESHHMSADTFYEIAVNLGGVSKIFGLTATDFRSDGKDILINACVGPTVIKRDLIWGIKNKWLANPHFIIRGVETNGRDSGTGDKKKCYKSHILRSKEITERIIKDATKMLAANKSVLCLVDEIEHGKELAEALGLPLATGQDKQSSVYVEQLNNKQIPGLVGTTAYIGEGTDTRNVDILILANFIASKGLLWQSLGRGMRLIPGKTDVIVLDYVPTTSKMLSRHAMFRVSEYRKITNSVRVV
jgi:ATP-dependent helicase IRC3